jgi:hypothetical protein
MKGKPMEKAKKKKSYRKPEVNQVPLKPDEAVLGGCKNDVQNGPGQAYCNSPLTCSSQQS